MATPAPAALHRVRPLAALRALAVALLVVSFGCVAVLPLVPSQPAQAQAGGVFISPEVFHLNSKSCNKGDYSTLEDDVSLLDDPWRADVAASMAGMTMVFEQLDVVPPGGSNLNLPNPHPIAVPGTSITVNVSKYEIDAATRDLTTPSSWGASEPASNKDPYAHFDDTLQDCAPRPQEYSSDTHAQWNAVFGAGPYLDAAFFEFSQPLDAFGAWFGDVETRTDGGAGDGGTAPAKVKLFDAAGNVLYSGDVPTGTVNQATDCGGGDQDTDGLGCGNQATRWIGFNNVGAPVKSMIVIVGEDDTCEQASGSQCNGNTEHLSWIGATVPLVAPKLAVTKSAPYGPHTIGTVVPFTISVMNGGDLAASAVQMTDSIPAGLTVVSATGTGWTCGFVGQDVTCDHDTPLAAGATSEPITVMVEVTAAMDFEVTNTASASHVFKGEKIVTSDTADIARPTPTSTPTSTPQPSATPEPTATPLPEPTGTAVPPTATAVPPTATAIPPTATLVPPTAIPATVVPPTATAVPPTATAVPPTTTAVPPTATPTPGFESPTITWYRDVPAGPFDAPQVAAGIASTDGGIATISNPVAPAEPIPPAGPQIAATGFEEATLTVGLACLGMGALALGGERRLARRRQLRLLRR